MSGVKGMKKKLISKLCVKCGKVLPLQDFYSNKDWMDQTYHDAWCKECVGKFCVDKETQKQYCYENNRKWDDSFYDAAEKKAKYVLAGDHEYLKANISQKRKDEIAGRTACKQFYSMMNIGGFYGYVENIAMDQNGCVTFPSTAVGGSPIENASPDEDDPSKLVYSMDWGGYFLPEQIQRLEKIYSEYEDDFNLDNINARDYARKVAKASLNADIMEDKMRRGLATPSSYKEAQKIFDDLSKSANFAACKHSPGDSSGLGSLGEIILRLEMDGKLNTNGFTFPEDDVDKVIEDYRHVLMAVGIEGRT